VFVDEIETPVRYVKGIGEKTESKLAKLGIFTAGGLLAHYPYRYEDRTKKIPLSAFRDEQVHTIAQVVSRTWVGYGKNRAPKFGITDGSVRAAYYTAFNQAYLYDKFPEGAIAAVTGRFVYNAEYHAIQCVRVEQFIALAQNGFLMDYADALPPNSRIFSIYSLTGGIKQKDMQNFLVNALNQYCKGIDSRTPPHLLAKRGLLSMQEALQTIHAPKTMDEALLAQRSVKYEELYAFQKEITARAAARKKLIAENGQSAACDNRSGHSPTQKKLLAKLPFHLTDDQLGAISDIDADIDRGIGTQFSMARLLQGDVGSGKTLVAFFAAARIVDMGGQTAFLAPTEILAKQHADKAAALFDGTGARLAYLTGNVKAEGRRQLLKSLAAGDVDIVIGTHALFSSDVAYNDLRLAVIDEQHRFGVLQRNAILQKGTRTTPHLLMMSATPIPRTLAITVFGDLDVSVIKTMPGGRQPIQTFRQMMGHAEIVYGKVRQELEKGHQAYFVYPRIAGEEDEGDDAETREAQRGVSPRRAEPGAAQGGDFPPHEFRLTLKSAEDMFEYLSSSVYPEFSCALIHSKISEDEQRRILDEFQKGKISVLVATSVIEVGIDNPNATCMVIEHAERFGLAALHQIRGRVGRSNLQSYCFLICGENLNDTGRERITALKNTTDGFAIAEEDLRLRGPGEVAGVQQSGYLMLGLADPLRDIELLEMAREDALSEQNGGE
jgi:ATP-dependent DNA helicase RecG